MFIKLLDKIIDKIYSWTLKYKTKRKIDELKKRDPFIYS